MTNTPVDWTQDICTNTTPPRRAKVVKVTSYDALVETDWAGDGNVGQFWAVTDDGSTPGSKTGVSIRNVRPGDFPDAPDLTAELAEALKACEAFLFPSTGTRFIGSINDAERMTRAALAKWEASK